MLIESKQYLKNLTDFQAEYLCLYPNTTIQFISIYNTEKELIENVYLDENCFNHTYEFNKTQFKKIKDSDLYLEWSVLYTNSQVYSYLISNYANPFTKHN